MNSRSFIQPSKILPVKLTRTHQYFKLGFSIKWSSSFKCVRHVTFTKSNKCHMLHIQIKQKEIEEFNFFIIYFSIFFTIRFWHKSYPLTNLKMRTQLGFSIKWSSIAKTFIHTYIYIHIYIGAHLRFSLPKVKFMGVKKERQNVWMLKLADKG